MWKSPSSIRCLDLNPRPLETKSPHSHPDKPPCLLSITYAENFSTSIGGTWSKAVVLYTWFYPLHLSLSENCFSLRDKMVPDTHLISGMMKLKSYCCEYLGRHLSVKTVHSVLEQVRWFRAFLSNTFIANLCKALYVKSYLKTKMNVGRFNQLELKFWNFKFVQI